MVQVPGKWNKYINAEHDEEIADIVIQVANFHHSQSGGILQPLKLGSTEQIIAVEQSLNLGEMFIGTTFVLIALSFLILYMFIRNKEVLSIGLSVFFTALFFYTQGGKLRLIGWFPTMDYELLVL